MTRKSHSASDPFDRLRGLPFVKKIKYTRTPGNGDAGCDGTLDVQTPGGLFQFSVQEKRSYLSIAAASQLAVRLNRALTGRTPGVFLLARHINRQAAEALIEAKVNFADDAGNIHLTLGDSYNWTVIGIPPLEPLSERRTVTPAQLQLLFQFASYPESVNWPVRRLESAAGIGKSMAAQVRSQMIAEGLLTRIGTKYQLDRPTLAAGKLISGYAQVLRPKLTLGRFRPAEQTADAFLSRLRKDAPSDVRYSITGGKAAELLQHFYRAPEATLFVTPPTQTIARQLRLLPDREGPITLLRAFGELVYWEKRKNHMLAPPWLIYAELMSGDDPRAHEAAEELRREFLVHADE
ncbi:MAG: hypothetical protein EXQ57_05945 [Bryobacterales bacterium]|nr:hypothetical protein [Bryobacterales bacterium]